MSITKLYLDFNKFPETSGVYLFKNNIGDILYIGKAKNLYKRIRSYFSDGYADWKIVDLLNQADTIDIINTTSEHAALMLEAELISTYQPPFNRLLKTDIPFIYIVFKQNKKNNFPEINIERLISNSEELILGPFIDKGHARKLYKTIQEISKLKLCNKKIPNGCLEYHLGTCAGSCLKDFNLADYKERYYLIIEILKNKSSEFFNAINIKIKEHNTKKEFEKAQKLNFIKENSILLLENLNKYYKHNYQQEIEDSILQLGLHDKDLIDGFEQLSKLIGKKIEIIDCIDISHIQSRAMIGSCVRFKKGNYIKKSFKSYPIESLVIQDDCKALQEVVLKRYKLKEDFPDILLVDGGKGQLSSISSIIMKIPIISLAKREETVYLNSNNFNDFIILDHHTSLGKLLISVRNAAHRVAIKEHRKVFSKQTF